MMGTELAVGAGTPGLLLYAAAYAAMLVIPGPSMMIVSRTSLSAARREAALVALGVACGASLLAALILQGSAKLATSADWSLAGRVVGSALLAVIGYRALRRAIHPQSAAPAAAAGGRRRRGGHFAIGLLTALSNPISFSFFSSVALSVRPALAGDSELIMPAGVFVMALIWFGCLAMLLSLPTVRRLYGRAARPLDAVTGLLLIGFAASWLGGLAA